MGWGGRGYVAQSLLFAGKCRDMTRHFNLFSVGKCRGECRDTYIGGKFAVRYTWYRLSHKLRHVCLHLWDGGITLFYET